MIARVFPATYGNQTEQHNQPIGSTGRSTKLESGNQILVGQRAKGKGLKVDSGDWRPAIGNTCYFRVKKRLD
jgi:hypothetical protein